MDFMLEQETLVLVSVNLSASTLLHCNEALFVSIKEF